jgi:hypothetical protein
MGATSGTKPLVQLGIWTALWYERTEELLRGSSGVERQGGQVRERAELWCPVLC